MNPSSAYTRHQRREGKFVVTKTVSMSFTHKNLWERFLMFTRIKKRPTQKVQFFMFCDPSKESPQWVIKLTEATPFKFELAHTFVKELDLKDAQVKLIGKFENKLIAV